MSTLWLGRPLCESNETLNSFLQCCYIYFYCIHDLIYLKPLPFPLLFSDSKTNKPPVLSPKPDVVVTKRFSFNKHRKSDTDSTSSTSSSPAIGKSLRNTLMTSNYGIRRKNMIRAAAAASCHYFLHVNFLMTPFSAWRDTKLIFSSSCWLIKSSRMANLVRSHVRDCNTK